MLKKIILATALVVGSVFAQNIHVGARAAGNIGTAWGDNTDTIELGWGPGFNVGVDAKIIVNPRLMCHLDTQNSLEPLQILGCGNNF